MSSIRANNWRVFNLSRQVYDLCAPIRKHFNVTYFNYVRLNQDNSRCLLTDSPDWIDTFYKYKLYNQKTTLDIEALKYKEYISWKQLKDEFAFQEALKFNIANGITLIEPSETWLELYWFGTSNDNFIAGDSYENNVDAFKRFILYFKDKGSKILDVSYSSPVILNDYSNHTSRHDERELERFIKTIIDSENYRFVYESGQTTKFLSKQETVCASYLILQHSMHEIAVKLKVSPRTVETYINNIKNKLQCQSKQRLIEKLLSLKVVNINDVFDRSEFFTFNTKNLSSLKDYIDDTSYTRLYVEHSQHKINYLTKKECELLYYMCNGLSAKGISSKVECSLKTTEKYINELETKFHVRKKSDLVSACVSKGILQNIIVSYPKLIEANI